MQNLGSKNFPSCMHASCIHVTRAMRARVRVFLHLYTSILRARVPPQQKMHHTCTPPRVHGSHGRRTLWAPWDPWSPSAMGPMLLHGTHGRRARCCHGTHGRCPPAHHKHYNATLFSQHVLAVKRVVPRRLAQLVHHVPIYEPICLSLSYSMLRDA